MTSEYGEALRARLQEVADEIGRRLGIALEVRAKDFTIFDTRYRLFAGDRALHNTWRSYSTMAHSLGSTLAILGAAQPEGGNR